VVVAAAAAAVVVAVVVAVVGPQTWLMAPFEPRGVAGLPPVMV